MGQRRRIILRLTAALAIAIAVVFIAARVSGFRLFCDGCKMRSHPQTLRLFCGGSMRRPMEELIARFEKANNVRIEPIYNGCGSLIGQMKTGATGDVYYACDTSFMNDARGLGAMDETYPIADITQFRPVIMVPRGNPKRIAAVDDLAAPGVKLGLGVETHGAVGRVGWQIIRASPRFEQIQKNVATLAPTTDFLCAQLATRNLDAAIVWDAVARNYETCESIPIPGWDIHQPIGLMKKSANPELAQKFITYIRSDEARKVFAEHGFIVAQPAATQP